MIRLIWYVMKFAKHCCCYFDLIITVSFEVVFPPKKSCVLNMQQEFISSFMVKIMFTTLHYII
jgi:hypothetical protein